MSTPPGQEPRPGFTPRAGQARPGGRGNSAWDDSGSRRGDPGSRKPAPGSSGRAPGGPGGGRRDADHEAGDYWLGGRQAGSRAPGSANGTGSRPQPGFTPARRDPASRSPGPRSPGPRDPATRDPATRDPATRRPDDRDRGVRAPGGPGGPGGPGQGARNQDGRGRDWRNDPDGRTARDGSGGTRGPGGRPDGASTISGRRNAPLWVTRTPAAKAAPALRAGLLAVPALRWVATWSGRRAVLVLFGASLLSLIGTVVIGHDPGFLIGFFLIAGSVAAAIGMQSRVHRLIPLPALSYLLTTTIAGYMHDRSVLNGGKEWVTNFLTWIGSAFFALVWATVLVTVIAIARWVIDSQQAGRRPSAAAGPTAARAAGPRSARPGPWPTRDPLADRAPGGNAFEADGSDPWDDRGSRDSRDDRDTWGDTAPRRDRAPRGTDRPVSRNQRPVPRDNRAQRDDRGQDPYSDPREDPRDDRQQRPKGPPPRDLW